MRLRFVMPAVALLVCAASLDARAFCRTMTCSPKKETCAVDDRGCVTTGFPLHWPARQMPLVFRFHQRHSTLLVSEETTAAVRAAFYRWTDVVCPDGKRPGLRFVEGDDLTVDKALEENSPRPEPFGIYFRDHGWPHVNGNDQAALTTIDVEKTTGTIVYADIEVNTTGQIFATRDGGDGIDLQTVVTHEVGHYIGLAHSLEPNSIMAAGLCDSGDRCARDRVSSRRLGADDVAAVCALYPAAPTPEPPPAPPAQGCAVRAPGGEPRWALGALSLLAALVGVARRRRIS